MKPANEIHPKTYSMFCPRIGETPTQILQLRYESIPKNALESYPGSNGDPIVALSFLAVHTELSINNAKEQISNHFNQLDHREYANEWISRWLSQCDELRNDETS